jgi:hypothetical protein
MRLLPRRRHRGISRYLGHEESVLLSTRQHPLVLVRSAIDTLALLVPLAIAAWGIAGIELLQGTVGTWLVRLAFVAMFALLARLAWSVLAWEFERIVVTSEQVIHASGVLERRVASTPLSKVSEFTVYQTLPGRIFDYGSLVVDVPGGRPDALHGIRHLPDPAGTYRLVSERARRGRVQEGGGRMRGAPMPTAHDLARIDERAGAVHGSALPIDGPVATTDPWQPAVQPLDSIEHTLQIPRIPPPGS